VVVKGTRIPDQVFDALDMLVACLDRELRFVKVNQAYATAGGQADPAWFVGKGHFELYPHRENEAIFRRVLETGEPYTVSAKPFEHPDQVERGTTYWDWSLVPWTEADGSVLGLVFHVLDVTERERAVRSREAAEAKFGELIRALPDGICILVQGRIVLASPAFQALLHADEADLLGQELTSFLPESEHETLEHLLAHPGRSPDDKRELRIEPGPGVRRHALAQTQLLDFEGGEAILLALRDVTESRRIKRGLERAARLEALGRLAGGMAHDFNNLLLVIRSTAGIVGLERPGDADLTRDLGEIVAATERGAELTQQLLAYGQRQALRLELVQVDELLQSHSRFLRRALGEDIDLILTLDPAPATINVDPALFEGVITNLLLNARKAMPRGGRVHIETSRTDSGPSHLPDGLGWVVIRIRDTGIGMSADTLEHIFEPFWSSADEPGHGLGLVSALGTIQQSGGAMEVESEEGTGTEFRLYLPLAESGSATPQATVTPPKRPSRGTEELVLVVDDDSAVRQALGRGLRHFGYTVLTTADADGARTLLESHRHQVALLLTDVVLGGESGPDLVRSLDSRFAGLPVLYMSGHPAGLLGERGGLPPDVELLAKPIDLATLSSRVRESLDRGARSDASGQVRQSGSESVVTPQTE